MNVFLGHTTGGVIQSRQYSASIVNGTWLLMAAILIFAYKSTVTTYLTTQKLEPMPRTFAELADRPDLQMMTMAKTKLVDSFLVSIIGIYEYTWIIKCVNECIDFFL